MQAVGSQFDVAQPDRTSANRRRWTAAFLLATTLYVATANREVQWQDAGSQQVRIVSGRIDHPLGLALVHPVQYYLGRLAIRIGFLEPAFAITLISCIASGIAVANIFVALAVVTRCVPSAAIAAAALGLSHTFWQHATHTESYAIVSALLTAEWLCLALYATTKRPRWLLVLALLNGLGIANHLLAVLATPVDAAVILHAMRQRRWSGRFALAAACLWLLGTVPYTAVVLRHMIHTGDAIATVQSALFGQFASSVFNLSISGQKAVLIAAFFAYNFPGLTLPLAFYGLVRCSAGHKFLHRSLAFELLLFFLFVVRYNIADQYTYLFPVYVLLAWFAGMGLARLRVGLPPRRGRLLLFLAAFTALWTPAIYATTRAVLSSRGALSGMVKRKPYRDGYQAFFTPWGVGEHHASTLNRHAFELAGDDGLILVADNMIEFALRYEIILGRAPTHVRVRPVEQRADVSVVEQRRQLLVESLAAGQTVVLVPRRREEPRTCVSEAQWRRVGDLYLLTGMATAESRSRPAARNQ